VKFKRSFAVKLLARKDTDKIINNVRAARVASFLYKLGSQVLIDGDFPLHLYLELSRTCNYRCPMCMRRESDPGRHFPEPLAEKIISEAATKGPTSFSLHLFGEPLANPEWPRIVTMIRNADRRNGILLTTNGFFLDETACEKLIETGVDRVFVSMHSLDPDLYREKTGGGEFSVVLANIKNFARLAAHQSRTKLFIRLFVGPGERGPSKERLDVFKRMGVQHEIRRYHNFAGGQKGWSAMNPGVRRWPCYHPWFTLGIAVDGRMTVCCADYRLGLEVGNALTQSVEEVWKSNPVQSIRREHLESKFTRWTACAACDTWQFHPDIFYSHQKTDRT
jgi:MoaA/NifB/PqqE/SkfB family radical SAM enzyme